MRTLAAVPVYHAIMPIVNWLNRVIAIVALLLLAVLALLTAIAPALVGGFLRDRSDGLVVETLSPAHLAIAAIALPIGLVALGLLALELRTRRPDTVVLATGNGARLATETIEARLSREIESLPLVDQARPRVRGRRRSVDVEIVVTTAPDVDVPSKAAEINEVTRATIERLGLKLGRLSVQLAHSRRGWIAPGPAAAVGDDGTRVLPGGPTAQRDPFERDQL